MWESAVPVVAEAVEAWRATKPAGLAILHLRKVPHQVLEWKWVQASRWEMKEVQAVKQVNPRGRHHPRLEPRCLVPEASRKRSSAAAYSDF